MSAPSNLFILPFLVAFACTISMVIFLLVPFLRGRLWKEVERQRGKVGLSRLGGIAICFGFFAAVLSDYHLVISREILGLLVGGFFVLLFGLWDDFRELSFKAQGFFQVAVTAILFIFGIRITTLRNPFGDTIVLSDQGVWPIIVGFVLLLLWMLLVLNAVNWLDGLDGLLGGVSFITFLTVFFLSLKPEVNQPPVAILAIIGAGTMAGFLFFNVHPARILAGTSGSFFVGFLIAVLAIIAGTKIATALLVLVLPIADALWVIGERLLGGDSIFQPDQRHLHYKLRDLGWSEGRIAWFFSLLTALIALIALSTEALGKFIAFLLILLLILSFLLYVAHRMKEKFL